MIERLLSEIRAAEAKAEEMKKQAEEEAARLRAEADTSYNARMEQAKAEAKRLYAEAMARAETDADARAEEIALRGKAEATALRDETSVRAGELSGEILRRLTNGNF